MGLFDKKDKGSLSGAKELPRPATIIVTCNSIPTHDKATYWFEACLNGETAGKIEQNGVPLAIFANVEKSVLELKLYMKENSGRVTQFGSRKQALSLKDGETVLVTFENRRFTIS